MSTTTNHGTIQGAGRFFGLAAAVLLAWFAGLSLFTLIVEPKTNVMVFGAHSKILVAVAEQDLRIISGGRQFLVVTGGGPGYVRALYRSGAWLVLPTSTGGCGFSRLLVESFMRPEKAQQ